MGQPKTVLFVRVENSNRSQMAEAFARLHGGEGVRACSAGSRPWGRVNTRAVEFMREVEYDLTTHASKSLDRFNGREVEVAVTKGCGDECPLVRAGRREEWQIPDPKERPPEPYREVRDLIERNSANGAWGSRPEAQKALVSVHSVHHGTRFCIGK